MYYAKGNSPNVFFCLYWLRQYLYIATKATKSDKITCCVLIRQNAVSQAVLGILNLIWYPTVLVSIQRQTPNTKRSNPLLTTSVLIQQKLDRYPSKCDSRSLTSHSLNSGPVSNVAVTVTAVVVAAAAVSPILVNRSPRTSWSLQHRHLWRLRRRRRWLSWRSCALRFAPVV